MLDKTIKFFEKYYLLSLVIYIMIVNLFLRNLVVSGLFYYIYLLLLTCFTVFIIFRNKKELKFQSTLFHLFLLNILFSKNTFYTILILIIVILLAVLNFMKSKTIKIALLILSILAIISMPMIFFILMLFFDNDNNIYEDTHYYCDNYEIYMHSSGAMDSFHYTVAKNHYLVNVNNILEIVYKEKIGDTLEDYENILNNYKCSLVDEKNEQ